YFYTPESFTKSWQKVQAFAKEAGRDPSKLTATNQLAIYVGRNRAETEKDMRHWLSTEWDTAAWSESTIEHAIQGSAEECIEQLRFGRRRMEVSPQEIKDYHRYQVGALNAFVKASGATLQHVKAHGIQYHMFEENLDLGRASAEQVLELDPNLILMVMAMTKYDAEARKTKARVAAEGFADRVYADDG